MNYEEALKSPVFFARAILGLNLYPWQQDVLNACRHVHCRVSLVAANGSGKTANVNTPLLLWFLYTYPRGRAWVTSGSWKQIETQLWPNLRLFEDLFPQWDWTETGIYDKKNKGFIVPYSSTDPGKVEGAHENLAQDRPVLLLIDEAKSIPEPIFTGLSRCTPTFYVLTSSPGNPSGTFYESFHKLRHLYTYTRRATAYDCPHISQEKINYAMAAYGKDHPVFRSMMLAEFTESDDSLFIPRSLLLRAMRDSSPARTGRRYAAVDWAAGGDETVLAVRDGNVVDIYYAQHVKDTTRAARDVIDICRDMNVVSCIGDAAGMGQAIMQAAKDANGFGFREFWGGKPATDSSRYANANAEAWSLFRRDLEQGKVCFSKVLDDDTIDQFCNRFMLTDSQGRVKCESKKDMKARGVSSPDRADAVIMAWWHGRYGSPSKPRSMTARNKHRKRNRNVVYIGHNMTF